MHTETIETCPRVSSYIQRSICIEPPTAKSQLLMPVEQKCPPLIPGKKKKKKGGGGVCVCHKSKNVTMTKLLSYQRRLCLRCNAAPVGATKKPVKPIFLCVCVYVATGPLSEVVT